MDQAVQCGKPKRPLGRPRKSVEEKMRQFSIRLRPQEKSILEGIARDRGISLSKAVEWCICQSALSPFPVLFSGALLGGGLIPEPCRKPS
jgi:hypothetical protein